jgi:hypothetical protein
MDLIDIFNNSLPTNNLSLEKNYPSQKFYDITLIMKDRYKMELFNDIYTVIAFLEEKSYNSRKMTVRQLEYAIKELNYLVHLDKISENTINNRFYHYLRMIYTLQLCFLRHVNKLDFYMNIVNLNCHFAIWKVYFEEIYKLYPEIRLFNGKNVYLDDPIK